MLVPLLDGEKGGWRLRETFATSVSGAIVALLAVFAVLVEYPPPADVSDEHVAKYYLYYFQVLFRSASAWLLRPGLPDPNLYLAAHAAALPSLILRRKTAQKQLDLQRQDICPSPDGLVLTLASS